MSRSWEVCGDSFGEALGAEDGLKGQGKVGLVGLNGLFTAGGNTNVFHSQLWQTSEHFKTRDNFSSPSETGADPESVCVAIVIVEGECEDEEEEGEEEEQEGRTPCSCVFCLITSSYDGGG